MHRRLMCSGVFERGVPHTLHVLAGAPLVALATKANHRFALVAHQIVRRDADSPAKTRGLRDDLVSGVNRLGPADFRDRRHLFN